MTKKKERYYLFEYNFLNIQVFCFILTALFILLTIGIYKLFNFNFMADMDKIIDNLMGSKFLLFIIIMILWLILHEIIHGISYVFYGANYKNIKYGVVLEKGILYCKCGEYIDKKNILMSVINPFIYIGIVTLLLGFTFESIMLIVLSLLNISGACADIMMFMFFVKRDKNMKFKEIKDSSTFILKTTEDLTDKKFFAVKLKEELKKDDIEENDKLITITKFSKVLLVILFILLILSVVFAFL